MHRRSVALWLSTAVHIGIGLLVVALTSERSQGAGAPGATPRTIQLSGKSGHRLPGRDVLLEVLDGDGMPIRLTSTTGDAAVGLAWWSPSVGLWLALDELSTARAGRRFEVSLTVGSNRPEPVGTIDVDEHGSGRIVTVWTAERPAAGTPVKLTVSEPGSVWRLLRRSAVLAGSAPMRK